MMPQTIDRYQILSEIGRGGMAIIYRASDPRFKREVAIKVLPQEYLDDATFRARFEREAEIIAALEHVGIVPVHDYGEQDGQPYIVMRLMHGGSLADRLKRGPLPLAEAARLYQRLAPPLDRAHARGVIHRDLKPSNILFDEDNNAYISDFGIAKFNQAALTVTGEKVLGTPAYMSPEQALARPNLDGRSDVYALGAILFHILTGREPYEANNAIGLAYKHLNDPIPNVLEARRDLPGGLQTIINRAMAKDPGGRYANVGQLAQALSALEQAVRAGASGAAGPRAPAEPAPAPRRPEAATIVEPLAAMPAAPPPPVRFAADSSYQQPRQQAPGPAVPPPVYAGSHQPPRQPAQAPPAVRRTRPWGLLAAIFIGLPCGLIVLAAIGFSALSAMRGAAGPTATPDPLLLLQDDFSDTSSGWAAPAGSQGTALYSGGALQVQTPSEDALAFGLAGVDIEHIYAEVTVRNQGAAEDAGLGIICGYQDPNLFYSLGISPDGLYAIARVEDGVHTYLSSPDDTWERSDDIPEFASTYRLGAECGGDGLLALFVDGVLIAEAHDARAGGGDIGLFVQSFGVAPAEASFDDLVVWPAARELAAAPRASPTPADDPDATPAPAATATRQPAPTATIPAGPTLDPSVLFADDFSDPGTGWEVGADTGWRVGYQSGAYEIQALAADSIVWGNPALDVSNVRVEVTAITGGQSGEAMFGVMCNYISQNLFYYLGITAEGYYGILKVEDGDHRLLNAETWQQSDRIARNADAYRLRADCGGDGRLALYVDGQIVAEATDTTARRGNVGLFVSVAQQFPVVVRFDDLLVVRLE